MVLDQSQVSHQQKELEGNKMTEIITMIINIFHEHALDMR